MTDTHPLRSQKRLEYLKSPKIELLLAPYGFGGTDNLAQEGTNSLIEAELDRRLEAIGCELSLIEPPRLGPFEIQEDAQRIRNIDSIIKINSWIKDRVSDSINSNHIPIILGGDSSLCIASAQGLANAYKDNLGILWLSNHLSNSSPEVTKSWNANRMVFSVLSHEGDLSNVHSDFAALVQGGFTETTKPWQAIVNSKNIVQLGISHRSAQDKAEHQYFSMEDIEEISARTAVSEAIKLLDHCEKIHVIWDINSLDLRAVSNFSLGQLKYREALSIAREIDLSLRRTNKLSSIDIVEYCPSREAWDKVGEAAEWITDIIANIFGENIFNSLRKY